MYSYLGLVQTANSLSKKLGISQLMGDVNLSTVFLHLRVTNLSRIQKESQVPSHLEEEGRIK